MAYKFDCFHFTGYKPCKYKRACDGCPHHAPVSKRVCVLSLEAMGAVLRSTCLLAPIMRKYPGAHITWITLPSSRPLLEHNPFIHRLLSLDTKTMGVLEHLEFDVLMAVDKSLEAGALAERIKAKEKFGFGLTGGGAIRPLNPEAEYQFDVGLDDHLKFHVNQKPETQQTTESMAMKWARDEYVLELTADEKAQVARHRQSMVQAADGIIGYNTGCSILYPYKKFTVERSIEVIRMWREKFPRHVVALLGGREDTERQQAMKAAFAKDPYVVNTPTQAGLREGILWMAATDMVLSGCSLGMHIAIGLKKPVIAWFGVSCIQEVDLYDRGIKIQSEVGCSPCWRKSCDNEPKCFNQVSVKAITEATQEILKNTPSRK